MTSAYSVCPYTLSGWGKGITSVSPSGEEYAIAEVNFLCQAPGSFSAVNHMAAWAFREENNNNNNNNNKTSSFFPLNFNVYINLDNRERAGSEK